MKRKYEYYRFSQYGEFDQALLSWWLHFIYKGIPVAVGQLEAGIGGYALWVWDEENKTYGGNKARGEEPNSEELKGRVWMSANGFREEFEELK
jgi:hypothetical protein